MQKPFCVLIALVLFSTPALSADPLSIFDGIWVPVSPAGSHVTFNRVGLGTREASLWFGQASIRVSDGTAGSNFKMSGDNFTCYYFVSKISKREMAWDLKKGSPVCPDTAHFKKDPP